MVKIAVISALERELFPLLEHISTGNKNGWKKHKESVYKNDGINHEIYAAYVGVGKVNAAYKTAEIICEYSPGLIVNIGYAGGMSKDAKHGDIVIGNSYVQADYDSVIGGAKLGEVLGAKPDIVPFEFIAVLEKQCEMEGYRYVTGRIATGDFFLTDSKRKAEIIKAFSPCAFDMESAAIAYVCAEKALPFVSVRTLSDLADDKAETSFSGLSEPIEYRPVKVLLGALKAWQNL